MVSVSPTLLWAADKVAPQNPPPSEGKLEIKETVISPVPPSWDNISTSADQKRVAFVIGKQGKYMALINGKEGPAFDSIEGRPGFSADSQHVSYRATRDGQEFFVVDGVEGKGYEPSTNDWNFLSPDSKRFGFIAHRGGESMMVVDGVEGKHYHRVERESPTFSPDSKRYLYVADLDEKQKVLVVDGVESKPYHRIYHPTFSPDSQRVLFEASSQSNQDSFLVVDGVEGPAFGPGIFSIEFSPDSKRVSYSATPKGKLARYVMVVDGVPGKEYDRIEVYTRAFSADSKHVSYTAEIGEKKCVVVDGEEGPLCDYIEYVGPSDGHVAYLAVRNREAVIISDGKEVAKLNSPRWGFSPDYQHLAYLAADQNGWWIVRDGKEGMHHSVGEPFRTELHWSPDSQHFAYRASQKREIEYVVLDGVQSIYYQQVQPYELKFSSDSKHFAYWACPASGNWRLFVDKAYSNEYDNLVLNGTRIIYDSPNSLHTLAVRDNKIVLVEAMIPASANP
ncbi:MAG TPA: hypothetical protein VGJ15_04265 [Pirellulales bacterium]